MTDMQDDTIRLIIRGDDMGMSYGSLVAFERCMNRGVMTCASVQAPAPWFEGAVEICKRNPQWCVGMHMTFVGEWRGNPWRPVLPWREVSTIVDENGYFYRWPDELWAHEPNLDEIEAEMRAQIDLAIRLGLAPAYVDSHYFSTVKHAEKFPGFFERLRKVANDYGLPVSGMSDEQYVSKLVGEEGIAFVDNLPVQEMVPAVVSMLDDLTPGLWLWALHPGTDSPEQHALIHSRAEDIVITEGIGARRAALTDVVCCREVRSMMLKKDIRLVSYHDWSDDVPGMSANPVVLP